MLTIPVCNLVGENQECWDLDSALFDASSVVTQVATCAPAFNDDGTKFFAADAGVGNGIREWSLSTPYDVTTQSYVGLSTAYRVSGRTQWNCIFADNGSSFYVVTIDSNRYVRHYTLSTPYDITTQTYQNQVSFGTTYNTDFALSYDGTKLYRMGASGSTLYVATLSTPFDLSTAGSNSTLNVSSLGINVLTGIDVSKSGKTLFLLYRESGSLRYHVEQINMDTPHDLSNGVLAGVTLDVGAYTSGSVGIAVERYGSLFFTQHYNTTRYLACWGMCGYAP